MFMMVVIIHFPTFLSTTKELKLNNLKYKINPKLSKNAKQRSSLASIPS